MTRQHFAALAAALRQTMPVKASITSPEFETWRATAYAILAVCAGQQSQL